MDLPGWLETSLTAGKNLAPVFALVFYAAMVLWTYKDARRRLDDPILIATAVVASMVLPLVGILVYMMLRPPEYLDDVRERELEIRARERQLGMQQRCPHCRGVVDDEWLACPMCGTRIRESCSVCEKPLDPRWVVCPTCEADTGRRPAPTGRRPRSGTEAPRSEARRPAPSKSDRPSSGRSTSASKIATEPFDKRGSSSKPRSGSSPDTDQPTMAFTAVDRKDD